MWALCEQCVWNCWKSFSLQITWPILINTCLCEYWSSRHRGAQTAFSQQEQIIGGTCHLDRKQLSPDSNVSPELLSWLTQRQICSSFDYWTGSCWRKISFFAFSWNERNLHPSCFNKSPSDVKLNLKLTSAHLSSLCCYSRRGYCDPPDSHLI